MRFMLAPPIQRSYKQRRRELPAAVILLPVTPIKQSAVRCPDLNVQYAALYFTRSALSSFITAAGSTPAFLAFSAHLASSGCAAFFHSATCAALGSSTSWPASALILAMPACSKSAHGAAILNAHSLVQWLSITFFCDADIWLYLSLLKTKAKVVT